MSESGNLSENEISTESGQSGAGHAERSYAKQPGAGSRSPGKWLFLCSFIFSCFLFWWFAASFFNWSWACRTLSTTARSRLA
jgi:hypothetical protein